MTDFIIQADHLTKRFTLDAGFFAKNDRFVYAVNDVSFGIERGKTYGLVGESGCGKTTTARMLVRMYKADGGAIWYTPKTTEVEPKTTVVEPVETTDAHRCTQIYSDNPCPICVNPCSSVLNNAFLSVQNLRVSFTVLRGSSTRLHF